MRDQIPLIVVAILAVGAALALGEFRMQRALADIKAERPPVVILDYQQLLKGVDPNSPEAETRIAQARRAIDPLAAAGYLVVDGRAVIRAPADLYQVLELERK